MANRKRIYGSYLGLTSQIYPCPSRLTVPYPSTSARQDDFVQSVDSRDV